MSAPTDRATLVKALNYYKNDRCELQEYEWCEEFVTVFAAAQAHLDTLPGPAEFADVDPADLMPSDEGCVVDEQAAGEALAMREFLNRVRSLDFIDRDQLPEMSGGEWIAFSGNPVRYFVRADDTQAAAIWREVEKRQRATATA